MAADGTILQGEVHDNPSAITGDGAVVEMMLKGFLKALLAEQNANQAEGNTDERI